MKAGLVIHLDKACWGVQVSGKEIYESFQECWDGEVRVLDKQANLKRRLGVNDDRSFLSSVPFYITVNRAGD